MTNRTTNQSDRYENDMEDSSREYDQEYGDMGSKGGRTRSNLRDEDMNSDVGNTADRDSEMNDSEILED